MRVGLNPSFRLESVFRLDLGLGLGLFRLAKRILGDIQFGQRDSDDGKEAIGYAGSGLARAQSFLGGGVMQNLNYRRNVNP